MSYPDDLIESMNEKHESRRGVPELACVLDALDEHLRRDWDEATPEQLHAELVALEQAQRRIRATQARVLAAARESGTGREMGFVNDRQMLTGGLGLSPADARGRMDDSGIAETPRMRASAEGRLSSGHLRIIGAALAALPDDVDDEVRDRLEHQLVDLAERSTTRRLQDHAQRLLEAVDPGRTERGAEERARRRSVTCGGQGLDLMAHASMTMDPQLAALMREAHARWGQPGRLWGDPDAPDTRTDGQRMHDAMVHALQLALSADASRCGAPAAIVIRMDLDQLATLAGVGETDGGIRVPVPQALAMARGTHWFLALTGGDEKDLRLFRSRRTASYYQRLALFAAYGGCTHPDCDQDARHCEAHHAGRPWAAGGLANIGELALASGDCHAMIHDTGWSTVPDPRAPQGVRWIPPVGTPRAADPPPPKPGPPPPTPLSTPALPYALLADLDRALAARAEQAARAAAAAA